MFSRKRPSATSLPPSPHDDEVSRFRKYMLTMGIRVACLILMVVVYPYGWYTVVFALGAIVLPYVAVVIANVGKDAHETVAERPDRAITSSATSTPAAPATDEVIRISETRKLPQPTPHDREAP